MICEYMGSGEEALVNAVTNNFGQQTGNIAQQGRIAKGLPEKVTINFQMIVRIYKNVNSYC